MTIVYTESVKDHSNRMLSEQPMASNIKAVSARNPDASIDTWFIIETR